MSDIGLLPDEVKDECTLELHSGDSFRCYRR